MITTFEDITYELSFLERKHILPLVVERWKRRTSNDPKVTMKEMIESTNILLQRLDLDSKTKKALKANGPRMRKVIHHIRVENLVPKLIANSKGYFIAKDEDEILKFIISCRERANSFIEVATAMEKFNFNSK